MFVSTRARGTSARTEHSPRLPVLDGITAAPELLGYVATSPKQTAQVLEHPDPRPFLEPGVHAAPRSGNDASSRPLPSSCAAMEMNP